MLSIYHRVTTIHHTHTVFYITFVFLCPALLLAFRAMDGFADSFWMLYCMLVLLHFVFSLVFLSLSPRFRCFDVKGEVVDGSGVRCTAVVGGDSHSDMNLSFEQELETLTDSLSLLDNARSSSDKSVARHTISGTTVNIAAIGLSDIEDVVIVSESFVDAYHHLVQLNETHDTAHTTYKSSNDRATTAPRYFTTLQQLCDAMRVLHRCLVNQRNRDKSVICSYLSQPAGCNRLFSMSFYSAHMKRIEKLLESRNHHSVHKDWRDTDMWPQHVIDQIYAIGQGQSILPGPHTLIYLYELENNTRLYGTTFDDDIQLLAA